MIARVLIAVVLLGASSAFAAEQSVTIKSNDAAVATLSVQDDAKVTTAEGKTKIDTKKWTVYLWVVPDTDTVDKAVPKIAKLIE
ncbi:MAG: hypothetical protein K8T25_17960, partial [Planctomycetia bacterium]|nr:hypothetical protein [Planctomycetia bacterium]